MNKSWTEEHYEGGGIPGALIETAFEAYFRTPVPNKLSPGAASLPLREMFAALASGAEAFRDLVLFFSSENETANALQRERFAGPLALALLASAREEFRSALSPKGFDYADFWAGVTVWSVRVGALDDGVQAALMTARSLAARNLMDEIRPSLAELTQRRKQTAARIKAAQELSKSTRRDRKRAWIDIATREAVGLIASAGAISSSDLYKRVAVKVKKAPRTVQTELPCFSHLQRLALIEVKGQRR